MSSRSQPTTVEAAHILTTQNESLARIEIMKEESEQRKAEYSALMTTRSINAITETTNKTDLEKEYHIARIQEMKIERGCRDRREERTSGILLKHLDNLHKLEIEHLEAEMELKKELMEKESAIKLEHLKKVGENLWGPDEGKSEEAKGDGDGRARMEVLKAYFTGLQEELDNKSCLD